MRNLGGWIEIGGLQTYVGCIIGENEEDARFSYAEEYLSGNIARPISIHLPLSKNAFSVDDTRNFFEGLLPEGFTRRCVAGLLHTDANDYLTLLAGLGNECLGAIRITDENDEVVNADYQKLTIDEVSHRDMAFSIGDEYDIEKITRDSFRREAANIGLGVQMAMKRFDYLANAFPYALNKAYDELMGKGFNKAIDIYERIRDKRREFIS